MTDEVMAPCPALLGCELLEVPLASQVQSDRYQGCRWHKRPKL